MHPEPIEHHGTLYVQHPHWGWLFLGSWGWQPTVSPFPKKEVNA